MRDEQCHKMIKRDIKLELSLITDIEIFGLTTSAKITPIKKITKSNAKTDSDPCTTISPNLGVIHSLEKKYVICDLPGLMKGAAIGVGLGKSILKHLINTKVLIFLLDPSNFELNINEQITLLQDEIYSFEEKLKELPVLIIANKSDLNKVEDNLINISALEGSNLDILLRKIDELDIANLESLNKSFLRTELEQNNFSIQELSNNYWEVDGNDVDNIVGLLGNEHEVVKEIYYRFKKSNIPDEIKM